MAYVIVSQQSAQELAERVYAARTANDGFFELLIVATGEGETIPVGSIEVYEVRQAEVLSTGQEVVHCVTSGGRRVQIIFPKPEDRGFSFADIMLDESSSTHNPSSP